MASCNSWQYLVTILAKNFPRSWQDLAKILLRYPWRVDPGRLYIFTYKSEGDDKYYFSLGYWPTNNLRFAMEVMIFRDES